MVLSREVDSKVQDGNLSSKLRYLDDLKMFSNVDVKELSRPPFRISSDVPAFKVSVCISDFEF